MKTCLQVVDRRMLLVEAQLPRPAAVQPDRYKGHRKPWRLVFDGLKRVGLQNTASKACTHVYCREWRSLLRLAWLMPWVHARAKGLLQHLMNEMDPCDWQVRLCAPGPAKLLRAGAQRVGSRSTCNQQEL